MKYFEKALLTLMVVSLSFAIIAPDCLAKHLDAEDDAKPKSTRPAKLIDNVATLSEWMTYYYKNPQPELMVPALLFADKQGLLQGDAAAPMQAFSSRVFASNPEKIKEWFTQLGPLTETGKTLVITAIWWSNTKEGKDLLDTITAQLPDKPNLQQSFERMM